MARNRYGGTRNLLAKYGDINTLAALAMGWNIVMTFYLFGAVDAITWNWISTVTIDNDIAVIGILAGSVITLFASDTKDPRYYTNAELMVAVGSLLLSLGYLWQPVTDFLTTDVIGGVTGELEMVAAAFCIVGFVIMGR